MQHEGAHDAGADTILVKDAHGPGTNIDIFQMPDYVTLHRRWNEDPFCMVEGLDSTFDGHFLSDIIQQQDKMEIYYHILFHNGLFPLQLMG